MTVTSDSHCALCEELLLNLLFVLNEKQIEDEVNCSTKNASEIDDLKSRIDDLKSRIDKWRSRR